MWAAHVEIDVRRPDAFKKRIVASLHIAASNKLIVERCGAAVAKIRAQTVGNAA
jgi:hypothetical protein